MHRLFKLSLQFWRPSPVSHSFLKPRPFSTHHFTDSSSLACPIKTRSVIRFRGPDTIKFLQGIVTNDVRGFGESHNSTTGQATQNLLVVPPPVYAAILTPQGRFLFDIFLYKLDRTESVHGELELLADVDGAFLDELLETLKRYRLRSKVEIESVAEEFSCWQRFGPKVEVDSVGTGSDIAAQGSEGRWKWYQDPRCDCLGLRGIFPSQETPPLVELDKIGDESDYLLWRLEKGVAEGPLDLSKGEAMPLEYNLAGLNAICFDKGCYIGQELIARTHHRGVIRKRLLPLQFLDDSGKEVKNKVSTKTEVISETSGKKVGTITTALGSKGLGLLRLEEAFKEPGSLVIQGQENVNVKARRPDWWPTEWLQIVNNTV